MQTQQIAVCGGVARIDFEHTLESDGGLVRPALGGQHEAQVVPRLGMIRGQVQGLAVGRLGLAPAVLHLKERSQVVMRFGEGGFQGGRPAVGILGLVQPAQVPQDVGP